MKKTFKILKYISAGMFLFLLLLFLLLSTGTLNPLLQRRICKVASSQINGEVSIAKLKGNILSDFTIDTLLITDGKHDIIKLASLKINYRFGELLRHHIEVDTVLLTQPMLYFSEGTDSIWNIEKLMKEQESPATDTVPTSWRISINHFITRYLNAEIQPQDSSLIIPQKLNADLNLEMKYEYDKLTMKVRHLTLETQNPYFHIVDMKLETEMNDS
ncbi:MAG: hypothetical protein PF444_00115, partial [Bacteroidales bacterium]|nr:hypothetical protein [Bacteroidales bacterium]